MTQIDERACPLVDAEAEDVPPPAPTPAPGRYGRVLLGASLLLIAFDLRGPVTSIGPVLREIVRDTGLSATAISILTTLASLFFGFAALITPPLTRRFGTERVLLATLLTLMLGAALRIVPNAPPLYAGQVLASLSIGVMNVIIPSLLKRDFPDRLPLMTGLYTMVLCASATAGAGATVPLSRLFGDSWAAALAIWTAPVLLAAALWTPFVPRGARAAVHHATHVRGLWTDPLAWHVMLFMGLQSGLAYLVMGWLPTMLRDRGFSPVDAGVVLSVSIAAQALASLFAPALATRGRSQSVPNLIASALTGIGCLGCFFGPAATIWIWAVFLGLGQGALFALAVTVIVLRSPDAQVAASLSGMAQGGGYLIASAGPLSAGILHAWTGGWSTVAVLFMGVLAAAALSGFIAGRPAFVGARVEPVAA